MHYSHIKALGETTQNTYKPVYQFLAYYEPAIVIIEKSV